MILVDANLLLYAHIRWIVEISLAMTPFEAEGWILPALRVRPMQEMA